MRFALFYEIPVARPWGPDSERLAYQHTIEQALAGERYGWDAFWTVEHHFLEEYSHCSNPEVLYGAIAAQTERIRLGYGVRLMPKPYNHPVRTAESVAVLDLISNGRVDLGTGRSSTRAELEGFGIDPAETRAHVAGGDRPRRRLLDQRHLRVRGRALVDAAAPRAAEADPAAAPADLGRHQLRRRPPAGGRARPRAVLVRGRRAARDGEGEDRHLPHGHRRLHRADRQVRARPGVHLHDGACARRPSRRRGTTARESFEWYPKAGARLIASVAEMQADRGEELGTYSYAADLKAVADDGSLDFMDLEYLETSGACVLGTPDQCIETCRRYEAAGRRPAAVPGEPVQDPARQGDADDPAHGRARHPRVPLTRRARR